MYKLNNNKRKNKCILYNNKNNNKKWLPDLKKINESQQPNRVNSSCSYRLNSLNELGWDLT